MKYRTELFSGSGERDAANVMEFEIFELGNNDILETVLDLINDDELKHKISDIIEDVSSTDEYDSHEFITSILDEISKSTGKAIKYALWLADKDNVYRYYRASENPSEMEIMAPAPETFDGLDIDSYEEEFGIILSDLGADGVLYGFENNPMPLKKDLI